MVATEVAYRIADDPASPVMSVPDDRDQDGPRPGIGLCLSGGGYRAMLFHLGSLWRLNELGYLPRLARISSVSGGSITAGRLGLVWSKLDFDASTGVARRFVDEVATPIRELASHTIDWPSVAIGAALPGLTAADLIERAYRKHLFADATVADLPVDDVGPRFVIVAASVQTGALFRFSQRYVADWHVGINRRAPQQIPLAKAVAASSAFAPILSPVVLDLEPGGFERSPGADHNVAPYTKRIVLTDGGNYDNLGLETVYKRLQTVLVSDAVAAMSAEEKPREGWIRHGVRAVEMLLNQTVSVRKRQLIAAYETKQRKGAYWSVRSDVAHFALADVWPFDQALALELAQTPTRLKALDDDVQAALINWGYVACDTAMRKHVEPTATRPTALPYPQRTNGDSP